LTQGPISFFLDVKKGRWDFPELKRIAREEYKNWNPDNVLIEAKATGYNVATGVAPGRYSCDNVLAWWQARGARQGIEGEQYCADIGIRNGLGTGDGVGGRIN
jgi:hypothetical protein